MRINILRSSKRTVTSCTEFEHTTLGSALCVLSLYQIPMFIMLNFQMMCSLKVTEGAAKQENTILSIKVMAKSQVS